MPRKRPISGQGVACDGDLDGRKADPGWETQGYRGARRRLVVRLAMSPSVGWGSGLMLALLATSALIAGVFSLSTG
jgi:hypothetical protein